MEKKQNRGFTLVETLVVIVVSGMLTLAIYSLFMTQMRVQSAHQQVVDLQQNIRGALFMMDKEIKMAGFKGNSVNVTSGFSGAAPTSMTFSYIADYDKVDNNADGTVDEAGESVTILYALYDSDGDGQNDDLGRTINGGTTNAIANNIDNIEFYYTFIDSSGTTTKTTDPTLILPPPDLTEIRSVRVTILARSSRSVDGVTSKAVFTSPSGISWGNSDNVDDGFYRRLITSNIILRNTN